MAFVTLQVLEGLERGRVFRDQPLPLTIGREEENTIRLNDERISRFHAKLQAEEGQVILTDLDSTNGTRVNGRPVQIRVLRPGDQVSIGRCVLLYGGADEINARLAAQNESQGATGETPRDETIAVGPDDLYEAGDDWSDVSSGLTASAGDGYQAGWAKMPAGLTALQRAQFSDLLGHVHEELKSLVIAAEETGVSEEHPEMTVPWQDWQRLLKLEMELAVAMRRVTEPD